MLRRSSLMLMRWQSTSTLAVPPTLSSSDNNNNNNNNNVRHNNGQSSQRCLRSASQQNQLQQTRPFSSTCSPDKDDNVMVDTLILGGGVMGLSTAYHLAVMRRGTTTASSSTNNIVVVEQDPTGNSCAAVLSAGGIRQQFSLKENIQMSLYGLEFLTSVSERLAIHGTENNKNKNNNALDCDDVDVQLVQGGYLFLASTPQGVEQMKLNHQIQKEAGCHHIQLLGPAELKAKFPWLHVDDILLGSYGSQGEGWFDPWALLRGLRLKLQDMGVTFVHGKPIRATREEGESHGRVTSVDIEITTTKNNNNKGSTIPKTFHVQNVVNATGAYAGAVLELLAGGSHQLQYPIPVKPRKRCIFFFHCSQDDCGGDDEAAAVVPDLAPLTVDPSMVYFRTEGVPGKGTFLCGVSPPAHEDVDCWDSQNDLLHAVDHSLFEDVIWPALYHRVPAFGSIKVQSSWAGLYDYNTVDQNAIIDFSPDMPNVLLINGFSGHGLQHSPAAGRAVAELIEHQTFTTLDLNLFRYGNDRFVEGGNPVFEAGIV